MLLVLLLATLVNLYYKPFLKDQDHSLYWINKLIHPIFKSSCNLQGFKCPSDKLCDCNEYCANGSEFVPFTIVKGDHIYMMNQKLNPGTYCLPKGVDECNLQTSYHVFSMAGWSCIPINEEIFTNNKKKACKSEEAKNNELNIVWDFNEDRPAEKYIDDYYEKLNVNPNRLRYGCKCGSKSLDNTPMVSVFPFVCSVDYCLRDIDNPPDRIGWNGQECVCGPFDHLIENDKTSPCQRKITKIDKNEIIGRVDCMTNKCFVKKSLICPTDDKTVIFKEFITYNDDPTELIDFLMQNQKI